MNEYNDYELVNKIRSFLTRKAFGKFNTSYSYKHDETIPKGGFQLAESIQPRKVMDIYLDRDRSYHYFRTASPRFNANR